MDIVPVARTQQKPAFAGTAVEAGVKRREPWVGERYQDPSPPPSVPDTPTPPSSSSNQTNPADSNMPSSTTTNPPSGNNQPSWIANMAFGTCCMSSGQPGPSPLRPVQTFVTKGKSASALHWKGYIPFTSSSFAPALPEPNKPTGKRPPATASEPEGQAPALPSTGPSAAGAMLQPSTPSPGASNEPSTAPKKPEGDQVPKNNAVGNPRFMAVA